MHLEYLVLLRAGPRCLQRTERTEQKDTAKANLRE